MSGDVQPRKRKDKKKRKDDGDSYGVTPSNEDVTIHVHKDGGTGGNICAKIIFFFLFSALIVLVGLIIKENQGLNELESVETDSRFSQIFDGWIDKGTDDVDEEHSIHLEDHDESNGPEEDEYNNLDDSEESNVDHTPEEVSQESEEDEEQEVENSESEPRSEEDDEYEDNEAESENIDEQFGRSTTETEEQSDEDENSIEVQEATKESIERESIEKESEQQSEEDVYVESKEIKDIIDENDTEKRESHEKGPVDVDFVEDVESEPAKESSGYVNVGEESESGSDKDDYVHSNISNRDDYLIRQEIDDAQEQLSENAAYANKIFGALLEKYPLSPRLLYGKARALDIMAEERHSNDLLKQSLAYYVKALNAPNVPDPLFVLIAERYIDRARFMGQYKNAVAAHWQLIERFPENATYLNQLAVTYLTINMVEEARAILKRVLSKWPEDGFALVHYGFILKTVDNNLMDSITYMTKGLMSKAPGVIDGRFYFHLGDALTRLDRKEEANKVYEEGVKQKVFMSKYQRSLYNVDGLTAKPWWKPEDIPSYYKLVSALRDNWSEIKQEGLAALNHQGYFQEEAENLKDTGTWKQLELFARGRKFSKNCDKTPITCGIIQTFPEASGCKRGQTKFSVMHPGTHVWPHCGPTNCRLRIHLGLKVPPNTFIRVAEETRSWEEGEIFIFDDSFEHEVWHNGSDFRLVLIVDIWHPDLSPEDKKNLSPI